MRTVTGAWRSELPVIIAADPRPLSGASLDGPHIAGSCWSNQQGKRALFVTHRLGPRSREHMADKRHIAPSAGQVQSCLDTDVLSDGACHS